MARCVISVAFVAAFLALAGAGPVPDVARQVSPVPQNPLDVLESFVPSLAPDMADPSPPARHVGSSRKLTSQRAALKDSKDPYRLPTNLIPLVYTVTLTPDFDDFTFAGNVFIAVNCHENTQTIVMHAKQIILDQDSILITNSKTQVVHSRATAVDYDEKHDFVIITLENPLQAGSRYEITSDFTGILNDNLDGFYRSSYKNSDGSTTWLATTQFESTGARRAFPCWDEPSFKARFAITINHDKSRKAISNMPVAKITEDRGMVTTEFLPSVPMSSYLVAFIVSDFESITNSAGNFSIWARKDIISGGEFSQDIGQKALELLGEYNGIPYALDKMDQAAIPDFSAGAMENWGLVTYREEYVIEQASQTIRIAEYLMTTICHELGHQWTGDLVTLDWWSHTWLNEGFADYFESFICNQINPGLNLRDKYVVADHHRGMELDADETMHAMSSPASTPEDDENMFDRISYSKGGAVIRMWEYMLGLDVLKAGMHRYLSINMFMNTNPENLFKAIDFEAQKASALPEGWSFNVIARSWTEQPGVPVVTVARNDDESTLTLTQERFFYQPPSRPALLDQRWFIPIVIKEQGAQDWDDLSTSVWLTPSDQSVTYDLHVNSTQWVLVNPKEVGYYRVNYDVKNWNLLAAALIADPKNLPAASRAQLINDAMALARGQQLDYPIALQFLNFLKAEVEVAPWQSAVTALSWLQSKLARTAAWSDYLTVLQKVTGPAYSKVGYSGSDDDTRYLRYYVASYACYAGNSDCIRNANNVLKAWLADSNTMVDPDTKAVSMCFGLRGADAAANFNGLKAKWLAEKDADSQSDMVQALACAQEDHLSSLLTDAISNNLPIKETTVVTLWTAILNRPEQIGILFKFVENNARQIDQYFSSSSVNTGAVTLLSKCIAAITSTEELNDARWWVEDNYTNQEGYGALQSAFLKAYIKLDWYRSSYKSVADWLKTAAAA